MDAQLAAALGKNVVYVQWFGWLDIVGDVVRAMSGVEDYTFDAGETGDADLDGHTFTAVSGDLISVSPVPHDEKGTGTVTATLSGLLVQDAPLLQSIGTRSNWRGREGRLWLRALEPDTLVPQGNIHNFFTGQMTRMVVRGSGDDQTISCSLESYRALMSRPPRRTYQMQRYFDPGDHSADAAVGAGTNIEKANPNIRRGGAAGGRAALDVRTGTLALL